jgi:hypothetical protein
MIAVLLKGVAFKFNFINIRIISNEAIADASSSLLDYHYLYVLAAALKSKTKQLWWLSNKEEEKEEEKRKKS